MKLSLKDRVLILNAVMPRFGSREEMILKQSIGNKIQLSKADESVVSYRNLGSGAFDVSFKTVEAITGASEFDLTDEELLYLKKRVDHLDKQGMFAIENMDSYNKILEAKFASKEYQKKWEEKS